MSVSIVEYSTKESRAEATRKSVELRRKRAETLKQVRKYEVTAQDILFNLDKYPHMSRVRVYHLLDAYYGVSREGAFKIMEALKISQGKRLGGLGNNQRIKLITAIEELNK